MAIALDTGEIEGQRIHIEAQGGLVAVRMETGTAAVAADKTRGTIQGFSSASRRRLIRKISRLERSKAVFLTLTYPADFPDAQAAKTHLRTFWKRIYRRHPEASAIWRLEFQKRGAPHFHLIVFNLPFIGKEIIRQWWAEIIGHGTDEPLFTRIEMIRSWRGVMSYASKYLSKVDDIADMALSGFNIDAYLTAGRFWGMFNKEKMPFPGQQYLVIKIKSPYAFHEIKRYMRRHYPNLTRRRGRGGVILSGSASAIWGAIIRIAIHANHDTSPAADMVEIVG